MGNFFTKREVAKIGSTVVTHSNALVDKFGNDVDLSSITIVNHPWVDQPKEHNKSEQKNCVNCGAVLHGNYCEFCGTEY